ncbi:MAG: hypothetical protein ABW199_07135 [Caulobacterales bacterium]
MAQPHHVTAILTLGGQLREAACKVSGDVNEASLVAHNAVVRAFKDVDGAEALRRDLAAMVLETRRASVH